MKFKQIKITIIILILLLSVTLLLFNSNDDNKTAYSRHNAITGEPEYVKSDGVVTNNYTEAMMDAKKLKCA